MAARAAHALLIQRRRAIRFRHRHPARPAQAMATRRQAVPHRNPFVEHETFAPPRALLGGHLFQIFEDAALQVEHVRHALRLQERRRFFAADAAGAEHRDPLRTGEQFVAMRPKPARKFAERPRLGIDRAIERADRHLVIVARVDQHRARIGDQRIPVGGIDIGAGIGRVDQRLAHRHDLALQPHLGTVEGHRVRRGKLHLQPRTARQATNMRQHRVDPCGRSGDRAVDAFPRQQQRAAHALRLA